MSTIVVRCAGMNSVIMMNMRVVPFCTDFTRLIMSGMLTGQCTPGHLIEQQA